MRGASASRARRWRLPLALGAVIAALAGHGLAAAPAAHAGAVISDSGCTTYNLPRNDDNGSSSYGLGFTMNWFGTNRTTVNVNNNGGVQLDGQVFQIYSGVNLAATNLPIIVPLFADLDTNNASTSLVTWGPLSSTFEGRPGYCVNWVNVGRYSSQPPTLSAQLLILNRGDRRSGDFDLVFNYDTINDAGVLEVGFASGVSGVNYYRFTGSQVAGYFRNSSSTGLVNYNSVPAEYSAASRNQLGRYVFQSTNGSIAVASGPGTPGAPTNLTASSTAAGQASLSWTAPSTIGGSAISDYVVEYSANSGGTWATFADGTSTSTTATVTGLTNGTSYVFRVAATNAQGTGGQSAQSSAVTPSTVPGAPTSLVATPADGSASIAFTQSDTGGSAITNYKASVDGGAYTALSPADATSPVTVTGLTNGTTHTIKLRAVNANGDGAESAAVTVTPRTTPAAPTITGITTGDLSLSVAITAGGNGGSAITGYEYSTDNGTTWLARQDGGGTTSPLVISKLSTNGTSPLIDGATYQVRIRAVNVVGSGTQSAASNATAVNVPGTVTAPTQPVFDSNQSGQEPGDFVLSNFNPTDTLLVSVGFVDPPAGTSFTLPVTGGLTAGYGYDFTGGKTQISFTGTQANANAALAAMTVATGSNTGNITIRVTASVNATNTYYNPINGHFYLVVNRASTYAYNSSSTASSAWHLAETHTLHGLKGYLATITTAQEQKFIYGNVNVSDFWIGASDDVNVINAALGAGTYANQTAAEGKWHWVSGPEAGQQFWQGASTSGLWIAKASPNGTLSRTAGNVAFARYENWCTGNAGPEYTLTAARSNGEPNNWSPGEHFALEKWNGANCWNDYGSNGSGPQNYYLVEFSEGFGTGVNARGAFGGTDYGTATVAAQVGFPPRNVVPTAGNASATVAWDAPTSGVVSGYSVAASPQVGGVTRTCTPSPATARSCTVTGLTNGTAYTFTVTATFSDGKPASTSLDSAAVTPLTTPAAPTALAATPADQSASIAFTPGDDGGAAISNYRVSVDGGAYTALSPADTTSPITVTGLTNGTAHSIRIRAVNSQGDGAESDAVTVTPRTTPGAPTLGTITPGNLTLSVAFTAGADGGAAISTYRYSTDNGTTWQTRQDGGGSASPLVISTLSSNGTSPLVASSTYQVRLQAVNAAGNGTASAATSATAASLPAAPGNVAVAVGSRTATVTWDAPNANGSPLIDYVVTGDNGAGTCTTPDAATRTCTFTGLTNGTTYSFTVAARNAVGTGTASSAATGAPYGAFMPTSALDLRVTTWRPLGDFMTGVPRLEGFTGDVRVTVTATNATLRLTTIGGLAAVTGYSSGAWTTGTASLGFRGAIADVNAALATLQAQGTSAGTAASITLDVSPGSAAYDASTGRFYEYVTTGVTWVEARCRAKYANGTFSSGASGDQCVSSNGQALTRRTLDGNAGSLRGYLATSTSSAENAFIAGKVGTNPAWIGGNDRTTEGVWVWADGPEANLQFSDQGTRVGGCGITRTGQSVSGRYVQWNNLEPNDCSGDEDAVQIVSGGNGNWNDLPANGSTLGYVIEYGGDGGTAPQTAAATSTGAVRNAPIVTTSAATSVSTTTATLNGTVNPATETTTADWILGGASDLSDGTANAVGGSMTGSTAIATPLALTGLVPNTLYRYRLSAANTLGTTDSAIGSFTTLPPTATGVAASRGDGALDVSWTVPAPVGAASITWTATATPTSGTARTCTSSGTGCTIQSLVNGTSYTVTVRGQNAGGTGTASAPSAAVTPAAVPSAPGTPTTAHGDGTATLQWAAPASNGGSAITSYEVEVSADGGAWTTPSATTACATPSDRCTVVTGLQNGTSYRFRVRAASAAGSGAWSAESSTLTPSRAPDAPGTLVLTPGNGGVAISWTAVSDGGNPVSSTDVEVDDGSGWTTATTTSCPTPSATCLVATGLQNGTAYAFRVRTANVNGAGAWSGSASSTPRTVPGQPAGVQVAVGVRSATVTWSAPASDGGAAISGYTVTASPGGRTCTWTSGALECAITGLSDDVEYSFAITAANAAGDGTASTAVLGRTFAAPAAPANVQVIAGVGRATVTWGAPASTGGSPITGYTVTASPGGRTCTWTTGPLECDVTGLSSGIDYIFTVVATSAVGDGAASTGATGRTFSPPGAPTDVIATPGVGLATVTWGAPASNGGTPITGYTVTASPGGQTCTWTAGPLECVVTGLTNGVQYTFSVVASNAVGGGTASTPSAAVTPRLATVPVETVKELAEDSTNVGRNGSAQVALACGEGGACQTEVVMRVGGFEMRSTGTLQPGQSTTASMDLPEEVQRRLARLGTIEVTMRITIASDAGTITVEVPVVLEAPPADRTDEWEGRPRIDGSTDVAARCLGTLVSRCDGEVILYEGDLTALRARQGDASERTVIGVATIGGPAGSLMVTNAKLNATGRALLVRNRTLVVSPEIVMKGATGAGRLKAYRLTLMNERQWLQAALKTLYVGGQPRLDLNLVLDGVRAGTTSPSAGARIIERQILRKRLKAQSAALALPEPPRDLKAIEADLQRAFELSIAANRHYIAYLRTGDDNRWGSAWRLSQRATETKARLMQRLQAAGKRHRIVVPPASSLWP